MLPKTLSAEDRARLAGHKATLLSAVKWTPGQTITVSFLEGDPGLRERVEKVAREWTKLANLQLAFVNKAQIRIAFMPGKGSWSYLGKDCEWIPEPPGGTLEVRLNVAVYGNGPSTGHQQQYGSVALTAVG
jgi:hypothetical protein